MSLKGRAIPTLSFVKKFLLVIIFLVLIYAIVSFFNKEYFFEKRLPRISQEDSELRSLSQRTKSNYVTFLKDIQTRDIFTPAYADLGSNSGEDFAKIVENLTLVGIIAGSPAKVIIEDKLTQKTFYLREGEGFLEDVGVESIGQDSVILNLRGKTFELFL